MNDRTRLELLERMLVQAREVCARQGWAMPEMCVGELAPGPGNHLAGLVRDIDALAAHTPEPKEDGETVRLGLLRSRQDGCYLATEEPEHEDPRDWEHVGNLVFRAPPLPTIPLIPAEVERGE